MALGLVADDGRLGFKKVWGRDEGWVVYGFEGGLSQSFSVFLVCGSELCGSNWEMNWESGSEWEIKWWEGGSEKWGWSAREMSGSNWEMSVTEWEMEKGNSSCVECAWERCVEWGSDWEMSGSELGAFSLGVWIVLLELGVWIGA